MGRVYCSSDWHGCGKIVRKVMKFLQPDDKLYFLGDCVDRGPDSIELLDLVIADPRIMFIKGNHEDMLADALVERHRDIYELSNLCYNGTDNTINQLKNLTIEEKQYYIDIVHKAPFELIYHSPKGHVVFLEHAGYSPFIIPHRTHDPLWDRFHFNDEWFGGYNYKGLDPKNTYLVHGHTPVQYLKFDFGYKGQGPRTTEDIKLKRTWWKDDNHYYPEVIRYCDGHKFDIDMCTVVSGRIALLDLDTFETIYFDEKD